MATVPFYSPVTYESQPMPLTVIVPVFETPADILVETVRSIHASTQPVFSLLVDDASHSRETVRILAELAQTIPTLSLAKHDVNLGLSAARNTGIRLSQTPFVAFLDSDDVVTPDFFEKSLWGLHSNPSWGFVNSWTLGFGTKEYRWARGFEQRNRFLAENQVVPIAVFRRHTLEIVGGFEEANRAGLEDWELWLKLAAHGIWGGTLHEYLAKYRHRETATYWPNRDNPSRRRFFRRAMRRRYPALWQGGFPNVQPDPAVNDYCDGAGRVANTERTLTLGFPYHWLGDRSQEAPLRSENVVLITSGRDGRPGPEFVEAISRRLGARGGTLWIATTTPLSEQERLDLSEYASAVFCLPNFLKPQDQPLFLQYLITTRSAATVVITDETVGDAVVPYLRHQLAGRRFVRLWLPSARYTDLSGHTGVHRHLYDALVALDDRLSNSVTSVDTHNETRLHQGIVVCTTLDRCIDLITLAPSQTADLQATPRPPERLARESYSVAVEMAQRQSLSSQGSMLPNAATGGTDHSFRQAVKNTLKPLSENMWAGYYWLLMHDLDELAQVVRWIMSKASDLAKTP